VYDDVGLFVAVVLAARADDRPFYIRHLEFSQLVVAVQGGQPANAGLALVAHYAPDPATALMFKEEPQTKNIITVVGGLCITDQNGRLCSIIHHSHSTLAAAAAKI